MLLRNGSAILLLGFALACGGRSARDRDPAPAGTGPGGTDTGTGGRSGSSGNAAGGSMQGGATSGGSGQGGAASGGSSSAGGVAGMGTAEELGCIVPGGSCDGVELHFLCPRSGPIPETCSMCDRPGTGGQGYACAFPEGEPCVRCCCRPTVSGCKSGDPRTLCVGYPRTPVHLVCVQPYDPPGDCTLVTPGEVADEYCCP
jgi:hypothetical protein